MAKPKSELDFTHFISIDFGTSGCGLAVSTNVDPNNIHVYSDWVASKVAIKCPAVLLLNDEGSFEAFGDKALRNYEAKSGLLRPDKANQYYLFYRFKMHLYNQNLTRSFKVKAANGRELPAIDVIAITLEHLKGLILKKIDEQVKHPNRKIQWILTVPAIWSPAAKQIMREAATKAGLGDGEDIIKLVLEPEAAAMRCLKEISQLKAVKDETSHYLLADCGGGTVDIVVHKLTRKPSSEVSIEEIHKAHGGAYGGFAVNDEFEKMLQRLFLLSAEELTDIKETYHRQWTKMVATDFEVAKCSINPTKTHEMFTIRIPPLLCKRIEKLKSKTIAQLVEGYKRQDVDWDEENNDLVIPYGTMVSFFTPVIARIGAVIDDILQKPECKPVKTILLVGGFAESDLLFKNIETKYSSLKISVKRSTEPWLAVLKGAIVFSHHNRIHSRIMSQTLGIEMYETFKPGVHNENKKVTEDGKVFCKNRFSKFVEVNESVKISKTFEHIYNPVSDKIDKYRINIYGCSLSNADYVDDHGCYLVGYIDVEVPKYDPDACREIRVVMQVSGTEIEVSAYTCIASCQDLHLFLDLLVDRYEVKEVKDYTCN